MKTLVTPYLKVHTKEGIAYGGNQTWLPYRFLKGTGCGLISAADVIFHLQGKNEISEEAYVSFVKELWMKYLPVIPGFGMNGLTLMIGLNRYFCHHGIKKRACWKISAKNMISRIDHMLLNNIPVILAVGPSVPFVWKKKKLTFYSKNVAGIYSPSVKTKAHFVTITGREGPWLHISSWGKEYYINIKEYREYVRQNSSFLVSNIIYIE